MRKCVKVRGRKERGAMKRRRFSKEIKARAALKGFKDQRIMPEAH